MDEQIEQFIEGIFQRFDEKLPLNPPEIKIEKAVQEVEENKISPLAALAIASRTQQENLARMNLRFEVAPPESKLKRFWQTNPVTRFLFGARTPAEEIEETRDYLVRAGEIGRAHV